jgi:hypothetical protein
VKELVVWLGFAVAKSDDDDLELGEADRKTLIDKDHITVEKGLIVKNECGLFELKVIFKSSKLV